MSKSLENSAEAKKDFYHQQLLAAYSGEAMGHGTGGVEALTQKEKAECDALLSMAGFIGIEDPALAYVRGSFLLGLRQLGSGTLSPDDKRLLKAELQEDLADMRNRAGDN
jgi:hypothetical protein